MTEQTGRDPDVLTTAELAEKLGLSTQTIRRMANAGQIPALKTGKDFRYSWEAVKAVLRQPHQEPGAPTNEKSADGVATRGAGFRAHRRAQSAEGLNDRP